MTTKNIPGKAHPRPPTGRVVILVSRIAARGVEAGHVQILYAASINERILTAPGQVRIEISNVAQIVIISAQKFHAQAQV